MGYEKFVKRIFPFIGNQYANIEDSGKEEEYSKIIVTLDELTKFFDGAVIDFVKGELNNDIEDQALVNHKLAVGGIDENPESLESFGLLYVNDVTNNDIYSYVDLEKEISNITAIFSKEAPYVFYREGEADDLVSKTITAEMLGLTYLKFERLDDTSFVILYK